MYKLEAEATKKWLEDYDAALNEIDNREASVNLLTEFMETDMKLQGERETNKWLSLLIIEFLW